jgi:hypothetical protein
MVGFDPLNKYALKGSLQSCWISDRCSADGNLTIAATCQPALGQADNSVVAVELSGMLELSIVDGSRIYLRNQDVLAHALQTALAATVPNVSLSMVRVGSILGASPRWVQVVQVHFSVHAGHMLASTVYEELASVPRDALAAAIKAELRQRRSDSDHETSTPEKVTVTRFSPITARILDAGGDLLTVLESWRTAVETHLKEATEELDATHALLREPGASQLKEAQDKQALAEEQLRVIRSLHEANVKKSYITWERARVAFETVTRVQADEFISAQRLAEAVDKKNRAQKRFQAIEVASHSAQMLTNQTQVSMAYDTDDAWLNATRLRMQEKLFYAHSALSKAIADVQSLQAIYAMNRSALQASFSEQTSARRELEDVSSRLHEEKEELLEVLAVSSFVRASLLAARSGNQGAYLGDFATAVQNHYEWLEELNANATRARAKKEAVSNATAEAREETGALDEVNTILVVAVACLTVLATLLAWRLVVVIRRRRQWVQSALNAITGSGEIVVVGRPLRSSNSKPDIEKDSDDEIDTAMEAAPMQNNFLAITALAPEDEPQPPVVALALADDAVASPKDMPPSLLAVAPPQATDQGLRQHTWQALRADISNYRDDMVVPEQPDVFIPLPGDVTADSEGSPRGPIALSTSPQRASEHGQELKLALPRDEPLEFQRRPETSLSIRPSDMSAAVEQQPVIVVAPSCNVKGGLSSSPLHGFDKDNLNNDGERQRESEPRCDENLPDRNPANFDQPFNPRARPSDLLTNLRGRKQQGLATPPHAPDHGLTPEHSVESSRAQSSQQRDDHEATSTTDTVRRVLRLDASRHRANATSGRSANGTANRPLMPY